MCLCLCSIVIVLRITQRKQKITARPGLNVSELIEGVAFIAIEWTRVDVGKVSHGPEPHFHFTNLKHVLSVE